MDVMHPRCAGLDVSKRDAKLCVRVANGGREAPRSTVTTWTSMTNSVLALREHLVAEQVTLVVMEATGDYCKPFYYLLEDAPFEVMLVIRPARQEPDPQARPRGGRLQPASGVLGVVGVPVPEAGC